MKFIIGILVVIGLIAAWASWSIGRSARRLAKSGVDSTALVTVKRVTGDRNNTEGPEYHVYYSFDVDGKKFKNNIATSKSKYENFVIGKRIPIRYLAEEPDFHEIIKGGKSFGSWAALFVSLLMFGCAWGLRFLGSLTAAPE